jgi:hypothetical protein
MVSPLDIFALEVVLAYIIVTPFAAYWLLRRVLGLKLSDVALGAIGYIVADGVSGVRLSDAVGDRRRAATFQMRGRSSGEGDRGDLVEIFLTWRDQSRRAGRAGLPLSQGRVAGLGSDR